MITDADIRKLKTIFATKQDLKSFATKQDLKLLASKDDLKPFATKEDLGDLRMEVADLKDRVDGIDEKLDNLLVKVDAFVGAVHDVREDNAAGAHMLYRHERQIRVLADSTGTILPE